MLQLITEQIHQIQDEVINKIGTSSSLLNQTPKLSIANQLTAWTYSHDSSLPLNGRDSNVSFLLMCVVTFNSRYCSLLDYGKNMWKTGFFLNKQGHFF
jgi:hypothetical protein